MLFQKPEKESEIALVLSRSLRGHTPVCEEQETRSLWGPYSCLRRTGDPSWPPAPKSPGEKRQLSRELHIPFGNIASLIGSLNRFTSSCVLVVLSHLSFRSWIN